jgi:integrase
VECSAEELTRLRDGAFAHRDRRFALFIALMMDTGARPSELLVRQWDEIDLDKGEVLVPITKTGKPRILFFTPQTASLARRLRPKDPSALVFRGRTGAPNKFYKAWRNLAEAVGRPDLRVYDLRHVAAARLLRAGATLGVASQVLGHSSLILHRRYGHLEAESLRNAQESAWSTK